MIQAAKCNGHTKAHPHYGDVAWWHNCWLGTVCGWLWVRLHREWEYVNVWMWEEAWRRANKGSTLYSTLGSVSCTSFTPKCLPCEFGRVTVLRICPEVPFSPSRGYSKQRTAHRDRWARFPDIYNWSFFANYCTVTKIYVPSVCHLLY